MQRYPIFLFRNFIKIILLLVFLFCKESFSQNLYTLEGKVIDSQTKEPLAYVSVFLSQTTIGATTDDEGYYKIGKIPEGTFALVASMVGYESKVVSVDLAGNQNRVVNFNLERSDYQFRPIEVRDKIPKEWFDQLEIFKKAILGANAYAKKCEFKNPYIIDFKKEGVLLTATAREAIVIQNNALGYKIDCVLKSFKYDIRSREISYQIYPSFSELNSANQDSTEEYLYNRKNAYLGSMAQLLTSLAAGKYNFRDDGFELRVSGRLIERSTDIVEVDSASDKYFLRIKDCLQIKYWNYGKRTFSTLCLTRGITQFDPSGFLIFPDEFALNGEMSKEGVATMLPRFWKPKEEQK
ncbi:MAG: hypothetical protein CVV24_02105 [Ignavibacteriae bacterium HGW-Ignavibacteriae-3]|nr:MAG: hypothetical protein CVV24_02105 [Ignavibacteriae bacterium HGW-Ignavibacteriae-3]